MWWKTPRSRNPTKKLAPWRGLQASCSAHKCWQRPQQRKNVCLWRQEVFFLWTLLIWFRDGTYPNLWDWLFCLQINSWPDIQRCYSSAPESEPHFLPQFVLHSMSRNRYGINELFMEYRAFPWVEFSNGYFHFFLAFHWHLCLSVTFMLLGFIYRKFLNSLFSLHLCFLSFSHSLSF